MGRFSAGDDPDLLGESYDSPFGGVNIDTGGLTNYFNNYQNYNPEQQGYELDQYLNTAEAGNVKTVLVNHVTGFLPDGVTAFENNLADTIAHEDGHNIGLAHPWDYLSPNVGSVSVTNGGSGYTSVPTVTFTAGRGGGAGRDRHRGGHRRRRHGHQRHQPRLGVCLPAHRHHQRRRRLRRNRHRLAAQQPEQSQYHGLCAGQ